jgi:hypothetical protein
MKGFFLVFLSSTVLAAGQTRPFDVRVAFGGWTLSPFQTLIERECERLIKSEFESSVGSSVAGVILSPFLSNVDLSSSGHFFSLAMWYRLGGGRFSTGLRGDYFDFRVPYSVSAQESLAILGLPLATLDGRGTGTVRFSGLAVSLLGRWTPLSTRRADLSIQGGLMMLPFQGKVSLDQTTALKTAVGDIQVSGKLDQTFEMVRDLGLDLPSVLFSPVLGIELGYRLTEDVGLFLNAISAQGSFLSGGLFFFF